MATRYEVLSSPTYDNKSAHLVNRRSEPLHAGQVITVEDLVEGVHVEGLITAGHLRQVEEDGD